MYDTVRLVDYFYIETPNKPGEGARVLEGLQRAGVNLIAFHAFPSGRRSQLVFIPSDPAAFKVSMAMHFLEKIPKRIPESDIERMTLEANIDSFLFFASSVIDVIKREINDEFELFDKENVFYIHGIRKHLSDSGKQKKVKK